jgi:cation diffusion facilitator family transporter
MSSPASRQPDTVRSIAYALSANLAIFAVKLTGAAVTGSGALLAESLHSFADTGNQALLLLGRKQAKKPPDAQHPFGHGRATYFWSFVVALMLFSLGGVFSVGEGIHKLQQGEGVERPWLAVGIVLFAIVAEGISLRVALKQIGKVRGDRSLWQWFRETRRSELIIVLAEDTAAITGLAFALAALLLTIATDNPVYDAWGSIAIGALLVIVAIRLAIEIKSLLIGESAHPTIEAAIRKALEATDEVIDIHKLITMQHGEDLLVAVRAHMKNTSSAADLVDSIVRIKSALRTQFPQVKWVFFEPMTDGVQRSEGDNACTVALEDRSQELP